jgi:flagellar basal-body rod modification protein FlgD
MEIGSPTGNVSLATSASTTSASARKASLDYDAFLKLLVAEMANQDPTQPMKSSEYVSQLASFSGVEQAIQTNAKLDRLLSSAMFAQPASIIGRTIISADGASSGTVSAVRLEQNAAVALLETGAEVPLHPGVVVK